MVTRRAELLLEWLAQFAGDTWEQRWLASGADTAPRTWKTAAFPDLEKKWQHRAVGGGIYHLIQARVLRPSYAWLLDSPRAHPALPRFLEVNDPRALGALRALPAYREALARQQIDAEHCMARVMIRTGASMTELRGEDLLHYADVVRTSGRHRREHLAWELLVALGVFDGAAGHPARGVVGQGQQLASTPWPPWSTATEFLHPAFGTCWWTTSTSSNPGWILLAGRPGLPAGAPVLVGGPRHQPRPGRPAAVHSNGHSLARTAGPDQRRSAPP